ncbi:MAG: hypothetical protein J1E62_05770 [Lachnospiraceae bacterium]|nr:hypothetical protein [Lachnospiraceae bacterium]
MRNIQTDKESGKDNLFSIIRYANRNVPFYMDLYSDYQDVIDEEHFSGLPVIDKEKYVTGGTSGLSVEYMGEYIRNELIWTRTSGTSGMCSEVYWHPKEMNRSLLPLWLLRKKYYDITAKNRMCYFYRSGEADELFLERGNSLLIARSSLYSSRLDEAYEKILSYDPEWMILQPSIAVLLCDCAERLGTPSALRYIEFTGEYLDPAVRKKTEEIFGCQTANQYGTKEVNSIAYECPCGNLHILSDNVYAETIADNSDSDMHFICVTSRQNYAMPLIRFQLDDRGEIRRNVNCECGCTGDILDLKSGRADDMVVMQDGSRKHPYMLTEFFHVINHQTEGAILQFQIEQREVEQFIVRLVLDEEEFAEEITEALSGKFAQRLGQGVEVQFEFYPKVLPVEHTGKTAIFKTNFGGGI